MKHFVLRGIVAAILCLGASGQLQSQTLRWIRPYSEAPSYWQQVSPAGFDSSNSLLTLFVGNWIHAVAHIFENVKAGERVLLVVRYSPLMGANDALVGVTPSAMTEVRFAGADTVGVSLDIRASAVSVDPQ
jgi:hypothetical protein